MDRILPLSDPTKGSIDRSSESLWRGTSFEARTRNHRLLGGYQAALLSRSSRGRTFAQSAARVALKPHALRTGLGQQN